MADEGFFSRWSRRKAAATQGRPTAPVVDDEAPAAMPAATPLAKSAPEAAPPAPVAGETRQPALTMDDVARLTGESDYSAFVARGVDESVKRAALKKLFADPHFNVMDGLDVYIEDYNKFEPIPAAMLASLKHARGLLDPLGQLEEPLMTLVGQSDATEQALTDATADSVEAQGAAEAAPMASAPTGEDDPPPGTGPLPDTKPEA